MLNAMFLSMLLGVVSLLAEPLWAREPNSLPGVHVSVLGDSNDLDRVIIGSRGKVESYERLKEVVVIGGRLDIYGEVEKLVLIGSEAQLYAGSAVNRDLVIIGAEVKSDKGSKIRGNYIHVGDLLGDLLWEKGFFHSHFMFENVWKSFWGAVLRLLLFVGLAMVGRSFAPQLQERIGFNVTARPISSFFWGLLSLFLFGFLNVLLAISLIGVFLMPAVLGLWILLLLYGYIHLGERLIYKLPFLGSLSFYFRLILGLLLLESFWYLPYGCLILSLLALIALGAATGAFKSQTLEGSEVV